MIRNFIIILLLGIAVNLQGQDLWVHDFETAKTTAQDENKQILIYFSGSDWCAPCIKLKRATLHTAEFNAYAKENLVMIEADFPRLKKNRLDDAQTKHNEDLAETYNQAGDFPKVVLVDAKGKVLGKTGYKSIPTADYIEHIKNLISGGSSDTRVYKKHFKKMGSAFEISVSSSNVDQAYLDMNDAINEIGRIESLISSWDDSSQTSAINRNAGIKAVKVDQELYQLIFRSKKISELTDGAFDISYASADRIWKFDGSMKMLPEPDDVARSVEKIDYNRIELNAEDHSVFLLDEGMKIGFGAIGKGYSANRAKALLIEKGYTNGVVNASGDLLAWGTKPSGESWLVGIADPRNKNQMLAYMPVSQGSVVTSGNYEKFVEFDGERYSHIIDPRTGYPVRGIKSCTIFCPDAELADALATSVFVLGKEDGLSLINQLKGVECLIIDDFDQLHASINVAQQLARK